MNNKVYQILVDILAELTGNAPEEITPESHLQDDLGLELDVGFTRLINEINYRFSTDDEALELDVSDILDLLQEYGLAVGALAKIIEEELALG